MNFRKLAVLLAVVVCMALHYAQAQASGRDSLGRIVVTAGRADQPLYEISSNVTVIDREEIETSTATTVGELLEEKNIGHIHKYPGASTSIGIRGFRTDTHGNDLQSHILVLLDGRRAGTGNLSKIMTRNVERIEIIRGPGAVQYGSGGLGGVVNIITRQGDGNGFSAEAGAGRFGRAEGHVGATALKDGLDFSGTYSIITYDDYDTGKGDEYDNTGIDREAGGSMNIGYSFRPGNRVGLVATFFKVDDAGVPGYFSQVDQDDTTDKRHWSLDLRYDGRDSSGRFVWMVRGFMGEDDNEWMDPTGSNPDGWDDGEVFLNYTNQYGAQAQTTARLGMATVTAGIDWIKYDITYSWTPQESEYDNPALFLLTSVGLFEDAVTLTAGLRHDWYSVEVKEPNDDEEDESHTTPMIGIAWHVAEGLKLRAQYAQGFMMPSAWQLAGYSSSFWSVVKGNPDLDPEKSDTYEIGLDYVAAGFSGSLTYFHTDFDDKIESVYLPDGSQSWDNIGEARIQGIELAVSYDLGVPLDIPWQIRPYIDMTILTDYEDEDTDQRLLYTSAVNMSSGIAVSDGDRFSARLNVAYTSSQDVKDYQAGYPYPRTELDGFTVVDLAGEYCFLRTEDRGDFTIRAEIRNLLDNSYEYVKGYPMPGIDFYLGLRWDY